MPPRKPIVIEPVPLGRHKLWTPSIGEEAHSFLENIVPEAARKEVRDSAIDILGQGVAPHAPNGQKTGLVVGYVQSGKTMSFQMVLALARDNGVPLVIVVAGIGNPLLNQSTERLRRDLQTNDAGRQRRWMQFQNPDDRDDIVLAVRDVLDTWNDSNTPDRFKKTVLITVLKNYKRLERVAALCNELSLSGIPVLVIDDEADQASLNTRVRQGKHSATYLALNQLRNSLPHHTYFQYTATPQAPLLISIIDSMSPDFVQVLKPGKDYVGGRDFFEDREKYIRIIPAEQLPTNSNQSGRPPATLLDALRIFMVGVTVGLLESNNAGNRSMLVHPSHLREKHQDFYQWVGEIFEEWKEVLGVKDTHPRKKILISQFKGAYDDLAKTVGASLPLFKNLLPYFSLAFRNTTVLEINARAGKTPVVDWANNYGFILVGAKAMDRGFTIEGLTVTYMPRDIGVGNADSIQQRARFFGYKGQYLGFCRLYLEEGTCNALANYIKHEQDIRSQLQKLQNKQLPLTNWKRAFVLDENLRPCRHNVIQFDYIHDFFSDDWVYPHLIFGSDSDDALNDNRMLVKNFLAECKFRGDLGHPDRTVMQKHHVCRNVLLSRVLEEFLVQLRVPGMTDSQRNTGLLLQLSHAIEDDSTEKCDVYHMSPSLRRKRSVNPAGEIGNLFQGEAPTFPIEKRGTVYPGDRSIGRSDRVTIQIHTVDLTRDEVVIAKNVPVVAVWVPARLALAWVSQ